MAAVVVRRRLVDGQDHASRARVGPCRRPRRYSATTVSPRSPPLPRACSPRRRGRCERSRDGRPGPAGPRSPPSSRGSMTERQVQERRPAAPGPVLIRGAHDAPRLFDDEDDAAAPGGVRHQHGPGVAAQDGLQPRPGWRQRRRRWARPRAGSPARWRRRGPRGPMVSVRICDSSGGTRSVTGMAGCVERGQSWRAGRSGARTIARQADQRRPSPATRRACRAKRWAMAGEHADAQHVRTHGVVILVLSSAPASGPAAARSPRRRDRGRPPWPPR